MTVKHNKVSSAGASSDPTLVGGTDWNDDHVVDSGGINMSASGTTPTTPAAGKIAMWARTIAGRNLPASVDENGLAVWMQPFLGRNRIGMVQAMGNSSAQLTNWGIANTSVVGTATSRSVATTNFFTSLRRIGYVSSATAGNLAKLTLSLTSQFWRGNAAGLGGFTMVARWGTSDAATVSGARTFVGMSAGSLNTLDPSTYTQLIGVGADSADSNLQIITNDGTGTATKIDLGANFPANTLSTDAYELMLFCPPNGSSISYQVTRLGTAYVATGTITTDLPDATSLMTPVIQRCNGPTALAVGLDFMHLYMETDN